MKNPGGSPRRSGKSGYNGPKINPSEFEYRLTDQAELQGWKVESDATSVVNMIYHLSRGPKTGRGIYISGGIHGDEPASAEAIYEMLDWKGWPKDREIHLFPMLNPTGLWLGTREGPGGVDLNRDYRHQRSEEIQIHVKFLQSLKNRIGLAISLHEDWEAEGFYLYELPDEGPRGLGRRALDRLERKFPLDHASVIDGHDAHYGLIHPSVDFEQRPEWPESVYLMAECGCSHAFTLEAPSNRPMNFRVQGLMEGCEALIAEWVDSEGKIL